MFFALKKKILSGWKSVIKKNWQTFETEAKKNYELNGGTKNCKTDVKQLYLQHLCCDLLAPNYVDGTSTWVSMGMCMCVPFIVN